MTGPAQLYLKFVALSIRAQMQYRAAFIMLTFGTFVATGVEILAV